MLFRSALSTLEHSTLVYIDVMTEYRLCYHLSLLSVDEEEDTLFPRRKLSVQLQLMLADKLCSSQR